MTHLETAIAGRGVVTISGSVVAGSVTAGVRTVAGVVRTIAVAIVVSAGVHVRVSEGTVRIADDLAGLSDGSVASVGLAASVVLARVHVAWGVGVATESAGIVLVGVVTGVITVRVVLLAVVSVRIVIVSGRVGGQVRGGGVVSLVVLQWVSIRVVGSGSVVGRESAVTTITAAHVAAIVSNAFAGLALLCFSCSTTVSHTDAESASPRASAVAAIVVAIVLVAAVEHLRRLVLSGLWLPK
jgi:hypothetical protein